MRRGRPRGPCRPGRRGRRAISSASSSSARASACEGSSAAMIPSRSASRWSAASASSSVGGHVLGAARVAQERVLGADARVVEAGGDRVSVRDLAVVVGEDRRAGAVEDVRAACAEAGRAGGLDADQSDVRRPRRSRRTCRSRSSRPRRRRQPRPEAAPRPRGSGRAPRRR